jgi:hypothetical protein
MRREAPWASTGGPLLRGADEIYDSFNVSYMRRWDHRFRSRAETLAYITTMLR